MISTRNALDGVTVTTQNRVEGKIRLHLAHAYFDTDKAHLTPKQAREVAADLMACAEVIDGFNAGAGGQALASPQRAQQGGVWTSVLAMLVLAALMVVAALNKAHACESLQVGAHVGTLHFDREEGYNEFNPGLYAVCDGLTVGTYFNSISKESAYVGETFEWGPVALTVGVVSGYGKPAPLMIPSVEVGDGFRVAVIPDFKGGSGGVHLMKDFK